MHRRIAVAATLAAVAALVLAACTEEDEVGRPTAPFDGASMADGAFETIDAGEQSGVGGQEPSLFVLRTEDDWREFWGLHQSHTLPPPEPPEVDFASEIVIAAVDGGRPSGGYSFAIQAVTEADGRLVVSVTRRVPGENCVTTAVLTQPYHIVRVSRSDLEAELEVTEETYDC